ncbi:hydrolase [Aureimonas endophytica]|uniref:Hydrolase n=1 Tax=Aureimonas endophytica TaxID=2027858 RepID=A0A916ZNA7_9HYPH|nr:alpha/beta fold hydrolase [Aureimonas endophytica]GGE05897.1 hydrolase [Aureimonas endophytica]
MTRGPARLADGGHLYFEDEGTGPPVVLVSGLGGLAGFFGPLAERLRARGLRTLRYDHRGVGGSSPLGGAETSIDAMAADLAGLLAARGIEAAAILGHSTGGAVAQRLALDRPDLVRRLVLSATFARPCAYMRLLFASRLEILENLGLAAYRRHAALVLHSPTFVAANAGTILRDSTAAPRPGEAETVAARIRAILAHDTLAALPALSGPTLVLVAEDDMVTPVHLSREIAAAVPEAELCLLPFGGHYALRAAPEVYADAILPFLLAGVPR